MERIEADTEAIRKRDAFDDGVDETSPARFNAQYRMVQMNAAEKIAATTRRLRETRAEIERAPAGAARDKALAALDRVVTDFARGVREKVRPK